MNLKPDFVGPSHREMGYLRVGFDAFCQAILRDGRVNPDQCWVTPAAAAVCKAATGNDYTAGQFFLRLAQGDYGDVSDDDRKQNDASPGYLCASYSTTAKGERLSKKLLLISHGVESHAELLLASEY
jgi:hypothetical protein